MTLNRHTGDSIDFKYLWVVRWNIVLERFVSINNSLPAQTMHFDTQVDKFENCFEIRILLTIRREQSGKYYAMT